VLKVRDAARICKKTAVKLVISGDRHSCALDAVLRFKHKTSPFFTYRRLNMTDFRKLAFVGLMGLGLVSVGCASNNSSGGSGGSSAKGGSNGSGGSTAKGGSNGSGGSSSSGGSNGSGGSSSGSGGATTTVGCGMSDVPGGADIATFSSADGGLASMFGTFVYGDTPQPTFTIGTGMVTVTDNVATSAKNHYQGFGIYMNGNATGTDCVDASSYTGVQFDLSGSLTGTGCAMVFSINDSEHADMTINPTMPDLKAGGPAGSYAPQLAITSSQITTAVQTIKVPFTGTGSPAFANGAASPATAVDPMKLTGLQWQLATPIMSDGGAAECDWNITLANVKFYH
jgi:hypothetical protein